MILRKIVAILWLRKHVHLVVYGLIIDMRLLNVSTGRCVKPNTQALIAVILKPPLGSHRGRMCFEFGRYGPFLDWKSVRYTDVCSHAKFGTARHLMCG